MMKRLLTYITVAILAVCAVSCNESKRRKALLPNISGKPGEVIVVINKGDWEGATGNVLRDSLACDFPFLPQREPMYDLVNVANRPFKIFNVTLRGSDDLFPIVLVNVYRVQIVAYLVATYCIHVGIKTFAGLKAVAL